MCGSCDARHLRYAAAAEPSAERGGCRLLSGCGTRRLRCAAAVVIGNRQ